MQIHTGLSVVRTCGNMHCSTKARRVTLEFSNIHLRQVTERLITQQDLCAGVTAFEPRGTFGCGLAVDEAWLRATGFHHHIEDVLHLSPKGLGLEQQGVV